MFALPLLVTLSALGARPKIASLIVVGAPVPPAPAAAPPDATFREVPGAAGPIAACAGSWRVPVEGAPTFQLDAACPEEHAAAVAAAAGSWVFGAVTPAPGQDHVEVRRWFVLERRESGDLAWTAEHRPPGVEMPEDCVRSVRRQHPDLPPMQGTDACSWVFHIDEETGHPTQVEVGGCPNQLGLASIEVADEWRFKVCDENPLEDTTYLIRLKARVGDASNLHSPPRTPEHARIK